MSLFADELISVSLTLFFQSVQQDLQKGNILGNKPPGAPICVAENFYMHPVFIFKARRIQRQRVTVLTFYKKRGLFRGKLRKQFLHQYDQFVSGLAHLHTETPVHFGGSIFQYNRVRNAEQGQHPLVAQIQLRTGKAECVTVRHLPGKSIFRVFYHTPYILQQKGEENIFLFDAKRKGLSVWYVGEEIAEVMPAPSTWFKGYDRDFFFFTG